MKIVEDTTTYKSVQGKSIWNNTVDHGVALRFIGGMFICRCGVIGCTKVKEVVR